MLCLHLQGEEQKTQKFEEQTAAVGYEKPQNNLLIFGRSYYFVISFLNGVVDLTKI